MAQQFVSGVKEGGYDKLKEFGQFGLDALKWLGQSILDPASRRIDDVEFVVELLQYFADNPDELQKLLPFDEFGEEGKLGRLALEDDRQFDAGRHMFKALFTLVTEVGIAGVVGKLADVAGFGRLLKRMQVEEFGTLGRLDPKDRARVTNGLPPNARLFHGPDGFVPRRGGHGVVGRELNEPLEELQGFTAFLEPDGALRLEFHSGTLNQGMLPLNRQPAIREAVGQATGRVVK